MPLEALGLEPPFDDFAREVLVAVRETQVELLAELGEHPLRFALPFAECAVLVLERAQLELAARELFLHLANGVLEQHVGFFDAVEHGMHVRREQPRHSIDERHEICLLALLIERCEAM